MEFLSKKSKKKKSAHRTDDEQLVEQSKIKKKEKKEFVQQNNIQIQDEISDIHAQLKKSKKKKNEHKPISNMEANEVLTEQIKSKKRHKEELGQKESIEMDVHLPDTPYKKSKKSKNDYFPNVEEDEVLTDQSINKKKTKKAFNQFDVIKIEENETTSKKVKKKKSDNMIDVEEHLNNIEIAPTYTDELQISPKNKEVIDGDSWEKRDYLELIRRMEVQLPKFDTASFTSRVNRLNWNQVQFGGHSIDECKERWKMLRGKVRHYRLLSEVLQDARTWAENPWTPSTITNKRRPKHPEQPTRPLSSYMLFYMDKKNKIMKKNPNLKLTEISRLVGDKYNALSEQKKAYYIEKARIMQEEYKKNLSKFHEKYPEYIHAVVSKKEVNKANKPLTPFKLYLEERLKKHQTDENFNRNAFVEKYKELWKTLSSKKKVFWIRLAKEAEDKYLEELQNSQEDGINHATYKSVITKDEIAILDRIAGKPEKPPNSAYSLFSRLMLQNKDDNFVEGEPKNRMREVAAKWKEMPEEQKKVYAEEVQHMNEIYKLDFANYLESLPEDKRVQELAKVQPKKRVVKLKQKSVNKGSEIAISQKKDTKVEPEKPPVTAWDLYKNEFIIKNRNLPSNVAYKKAAATWKTLSAKEVEKYKKRHEKIKEKYLVDFTTFLENLDEDELKEYYALREADDGENELNEESAEEESSLDEEDSDDSEESDSDESDSGVSEGEK